MYFFPFPDRSPKIRDLKQKISKLYQQIVASVIVGLILVGLLIGSATQGVSYLGLFEFASIIGIIVFVTQLVKNKLNPLREELRKELAADAREKEYTRIIQPPNERQFDEWISAISNEIYEKAPGSLRLHEHPDHKAWRTAVNNEPYTTRPEEPEEYGASLRLEGRIASSDEADEEPSQLWRWTHGNSKRMKHYSVYVFTALFITEDCVAIYTFIVNLRDATRDREDYEYCYHQHLSHMLLHVDTTSQSVDTQPPTPIAFKESSLSLTFDSGRTIRRNISTLHVGNKPIIDIANIHEKLTKALIDHERSMARNFVEAKNLE